MPIEQMQTRWIRQLLAAASLAFAMAVRGADGARVDNDFFEAKIRPVLVQSCYQCHSAEAERVKGGLVLDTREGLLKGGESGTALIPGAPEKSRLIIAMRYKDEHLQMPPREALPSEVVADFERWVKAGAPDPRVAKIARASAANVTNHWAFQPVKPRAVPKVKNKKWVRDPIDAFILSDLEERRFDPAPAADKRTLLRRATFDLTGLPPTLDEINAFLADAAPTAFATVVDRLLKSPAFGERWGRHWLDLARYSDSNGLEINTPFPNAYRYRDYVITAYNSDKPYNQFVREQLAGDLLPSTTVEDQHEKWIATGFLVLGPKAFNEPMPEKLLADVVDEQIDVTSKAFLGLTVACARCHDHKFDPIPTRDYYALAGIFRSTATLAAPSGQPRFNPQAWSERPLGTKEQTEIFEKYTESLEKAQQEVDMTSSQVQNFPGGIDPKELPGIVVDNLDAEVIGNWSKSMGATNYVNKNYLQDGNADKGKRKVRFHPQIPKAGTYEIRLAYTPNINRATNIPVRIFAGTNVTTKILNQREAPKYDKAFTYLGLFDLPEGTNTVVEISNEGTKGFVVVDALQVLPLEKESAGMMAMAPGAKTMRKRDVTFAGTDIDMMKEKVAEMRANSPPPLPSAMAVKDSETQNARIAIRGDVERPGDEVPRGFISVIDRRPAGGKAALPKETSGRLELADWIASPNNPMTARVYVNRVWQHLFGRALVNTPDNFGLQGEAPSNPELLDYLAAQFVQQGWSTKQLIRTLMLSSAYQMSAQHNPAAYAKDPDNRLVWRMDRRRLEAEAFRDAILAVSGQMDYTRGGPAMPQMGPNLPPVLADSAMVQTQTSARRSVYLPTLRNNLDDLFVVFDVPDPHAPIGKRHITSAATQALYVMNSPFVAEQAKAWSARLTAMPANDDAARIQRAFNEAFARDPSSMELARSQKFLNEFADSAAASPEKKTDDNGEKPPSSRARAWQAFCHALIATGEFRYLN
jgi:cytochrome c553